MLLLHILTVIDSKLVILNFSRSLSTEKTYAMYTVYMSIQIKSYYKSVEVGIQES